MELKTDPGGVAGTSGMLKKRFQTKRGVPHACPGKRSSRPGVSSEACLQEVQVCLPLDTRDAVLLAETRNQLPKCQVAESGYDWSEG